MVRTATLGFPRIGPQRELKRALESYWRGASDEIQLERSSRQIRRDNWQLQAAAGISDIPSNDFSLYDHVLDMACLVGAIPDRVQRIAQSKLDTYFLMARGRSRHGLECEALELTKWFDTNYHYLVPELDRNIRFELDASKPLNEVREALELGLTTRPTLLGPVSFLLLSKMSRESDSALDLLAPLVRAYERLLGELSDAGVRWVQIDEPCLVLDLESHQREAFQWAYQELSRSHRRPELLLTTYFGDLGDNLPFVFELPVGGYHLDLVRAPNQLHEALRRLEAPRVLELGVVDGRNVWRTNLSAQLSVLESAAQVLGQERVWVASSCSLLHSPVDVDVEDALDPEIRSWLAFAKQKLEEITCLGRGLQEGRSATQQELERSDAVQRSRATSPRARRPAVRARCEAITPQLLQRSKPYPERAPAQRQRLNLPLFPTTTIGSFPQTPQIRSCRSAWRNGSLDTRAYTEFVDSEIRRVILEQEALGLDVLVHGEPERNDMVEFFGETLEGFAVTRNGWVQSYGSRCVKPPIIFGDVERTRPLTLREVKVARAATKRPVKGMLTGPITILQWSFVRDDQPRQDTARQIALAIRDEVAALEKEGLDVIQVDEPALREGLPLRRSERPAYLEWAVAAFRLATAGAADSTQIHTHMCYADFGDIVEAIRALDADVISVETARSHMATLRDFARIEYPNEIGPGVYDIHSPRVPSKEEVLTLLRRAADVFPPERLWVNPDCGLKTRSWSEVRAALQVMVDAARTFRSEFSRP